MNGVKMISVTQMMKFFIHVNVLEPRKNMTAQELKNIMKLNLTTTFNFGSPNFLSLIQAFPDVFKVAGEKNVFDVELNPDCPCKPTDNFSFFSLKFFLFLVSTSGLKMILSQKLL